MASSTCFVGVDGEPLDGLATPTIRGDICDARLVEFVDADEVVESWRSSRLSNVWSVASGAKETRRLATYDQSGFGMK